MPWQGVDVGAGGVVELGQYIPAGGGGSIADPRHPTGRRFFTIHPAVQRDEQRPMDRRRVERVSWVGPCQEMFDRNVAEVIGSRNEVGPHVGVLSQVGPRLRVDVGQRRIAAPVLPTAVGHDDLGHAAKPALARQQTPVIERRQIGESVDLGQRRLSVTVVELTAVCPGDMAEHPVEHGSA